LLRRLRGACRECGGSTGVADHGVREGRDRNDAPDQNALRQAISGSRLVPYADTGHALHWEYPERFAKDLTAFMTK